MVVFLTNRANLQSRRLHNRILTRFNAEFTNVRRRRAEPREAGPYRVIGEVNPQQYFRDDEYPAETARVEVGYQLQTSQPYEYYWFNWIEPERNLLVGWHQDETHDDLGPVHLQVNDGATTVDRQRAKFLDSHPLDVVEQRLGELRSAVFAVEWEKDRPVGFDASASVIE
jgi:hypothetical protein